MDSPKPSDNPASSCQAACPFRAHWYVGPVFVMLIVLAILVGHKGISPTADDVAIEPAWVVEPYEGPETVPAVGAWPCFRGNAACTGVAESALPRTLDLAWQRDLGAPISSTAAVVDGRVYVGTNGQGVYALDLGSGEILWHYKEAWTVAASPHVKDGRVLVGDYDGVFHALDADSGEPRWTFQADQSIQSSATVVNDLVLFGSYDHKVYCLTVRDGRKVWDYEVSTEVYCAPVVSGNDATVISCGNGTLYTLDVDFGGPATEITTGQIALATPARRGSLTVVPTYVGTVLCIDLDTDRTVWTLDTGRDEVVFDASPAVTDDHVLVGGRDGLLRCLDFRSGEPLWTFRARDAIDSSPVVVGDRVFFGSDDGNLYAVRLQTGKPLWRYVAGEPFSAAPAVAYGRLVIGNRNGVVYCFAAKP
ncbi:MAG: PQQ-binding-like beta-propeller repeat protein [Planctomycetes bacterium]|nr:PQQ-binding-like beta-propeller repeat protein [Planctomycetota bacterium]